MSLSISIVLGETLDQYPHTGIGTYQDRPVWFRLNSFERLEYIRGEEDYVGYYTVFSITEKLLKRARDYNKRKEKSLHGWDYRDYTCIEELIAEYKDISRSVEVNENIIDDNVEIGFSPELSG